MRFLDQLFGRQDFLVDGANQHHLEQACQHQRIGHRVAPPAVLAVDAQTLEPVVQWQQRHRLVLVQRRQQPAEIDPARLKIDAEAILQRGLQEAVDGRAVVGHQRRLCRIGEKCHQLAVDRITVDVPRGQVEGEGVRRHDRAALHPHRRNAEQRAVRRARPRCRDVDHHVAHMVMPLIEFRRRAGPPGFERLAHIGGQFLR